MSHILGPTNMATPHLPTVVVLTAIVSAVASSSASTDLGSSKLGGEESGRSSGFVSTNADDVRFYLFPNALNPNFTHEIVYLDESTLGMYNASRPTKFLVHGFLSNGLNEDGYPGNAKNAYLARDADHSYNIISVDWGKLATPNAGPASGLFYVAAVDNVRRTGQRVGQFISWLYNQSLIDLESTHLVGHSLGSHVSGWAGDTIVNITGMQVGRISALDPAGPVFYTDIPARRIRPFDARFIDAYHTSAGTLGIAKTVGAVDFFVNGGVAPQPGCIEPIACSHSRSHQYFAQSILENDPLRNANASVCVCVSEIRYVVDSNCCDHRFLFGEFCRPGTAGKYLVRYTLKEN